MEGRELFELKVDDQVGFLDYRIYHNDGRLEHDPYAFSPTLGDLDLYLFAKGRHYELHHKMGGRLTEHEGVSGAKFSVWAPNARKVSLVGDFNHWDGRVNPMRCLGSSGVYEIFVPGLKAGELYKFEVTDQSGKVTLKADSYALASQCRPETASILVDLGFHQGGCQWRAMPGPLNVYEVHLGSWLRQPDGGFLGYRELGQRLGHYCREMGFTHVELLPVSEHPLDESWGYQTTGYFAATSRFGCPYDFRVFVEAMHDAGIGVILDWVPAHFPKDEFALAHFDGTALYEHEDPRLGHHPHWDTAIFNYGRPEVSNFLIASALYWLEVMHVDGLRVDAVASMLYLDYGREEGEWIANRYGGRENLDAIEFLKHLNAAVHERHPHALMIAEESTAFPGVTHSLEHEGLGFDLKWNMGWMNDTLRYFETDPLYRVYHHEQLTFGQLYAYSENFVCALSHDEVVHGKKSLLSKMPGDMWQKFAQLRLLYSYQMCQPGKKLSFMGVELAQWTEWNAGSQLEWFLLQYPLHQGIKQLVQDLNHFYLHHSALWEKDSSPEGFSWVSCNDQSNSVIAYIRRSHNERLLCVHNMGVQYHPHYWLALAEHGHLEEVFNTDDERYGGSGKVRGLIDRTEHRLALAISPLATTIYKLH